MWLTRVGVTTTKWSKWDFAIPRELRVCHCSTAAPGDLALGYRSESGTPSSAETRHGVAGTFRVYRNPGSSFRRQ